MNPVIQNYSNDKMSQLKKEGATVKMSFLAQQNDDTVICHACIRYATAFLSLSAARSHNRHNLRVLAAIVFCSVLTTFLTFLNM